MQPQLPRALPVEHLRIIQVIHLRARHYNPEMRASAANALEHLSLSHKPNKDCDLMGLRENFGVKSKWRSLWIG